MANKLTDEQRDKLAHYANQMTKGSWTNNTEFIRFYNEVTGERETFQGFNLSADNRLKKGLLDLATKHKEAAAVEPDGETHSEEVAETESRTVVLDEEKPKDQPVKVQHNPSQGKRK